MVRALAFAVTLLPGLLYAQLQVREPPYRMFPPYRVVSPGYEYSVELLTPDQTPELGSPFCMTRTPQGFLWLGTDAGILRFDGHESKLYVDDPTQPAAALTNRASLMHEDAGGVLWVATPGGLKRLDPGSSRFVHYRNDPNDSSSIPPGAVSALCADRNGTIWIGTGRGVVARLDRSRAKFTRYHLGSFVAVSGRTPPIFSILEDPSGTLWANAAEGIFTYDRPSDRFVELREMISECRRVGACPVYSMAADRNNRVWLGTSGQLLCFNTAGTLIAQYRHNPLDTNSIWNEWILQIEEDAFRGIWIVYRGTGTSRLDVRTGRMTHYRFRGGGRIFPEPPSANQVSTSVWFCAATGSFGRFVVRRIPVTRIETPQIDTLSMRTDRYGVWTLDRDRQKRIWAGSWKEDMRCQGFSSVTAYNGTHFPVRLRGLGPGDLFQTYQDPRGVLWFVTLSRLQRYDESRGTLVNVLLPVTPNRIGTTRDGEHWLVCRDDNMRRHYLARWDPRTLGVIPFRHTDRDSLRLMEGHVSDMCEDADGLIWFGTFSGGLTSFNRATGTYRRYLSSPMDSTALQSAAINALAVDSTGTLWVATDNGLHERLRGTDRFRHVQIPWPTGVYGGGKNATGRIRDMAVDRQGRLWLALLDGSIARFDPGTQAYRRYGAEHGIQPQSALSVVYDRDDDLLYAGGQSVLTSFHPDSLLSNMYIPPVVLTSFRVFGNDVAVERDIAVLDTIPLAHSDNYFTFSFSALDYTNPAVNQYAYRLEGVDRDWVQSGRRRFASYANLDPGTYVLRIRGTNSDGIWNLSGRSLTIIISPPWWRTGWAYLGYALAVSGGLLTLWLYDRKRTALRHSLQMKEYEAEKMREVDQMKSRFFANISHEFRTPLTLLLGPIDQLKERVNGQDMQTLLATMRRNGTRLLQLTNQLLDLSRIDAGRMSVHVRRTDVVALTRPLVMSFLTLAERRNIHLAFEPQAEQIIAYVDGDKLEKILTNLLSNALKFTGEGGEVRVCLRLRNELADRQFELTVSDTGIGIAPDECDRIFDRFYQVDSAHTREHGGTGIGLALAKELVDLHKGMITVSSTPGKGSTFTVLLPVGKEHWRPGDIVSEELVAAGERVECPPEVPAESEPREQDELGADSGAPVVLLVEDNADVRRYVRGLLHESYITEEAENGSVALATAREISIDLVISDVMMPVMDGVQLCRALKEDPLTDHLPVVLLTANASEATRLEGLGVGADDYIVKPFDPKELVTRAGNLIQVRRKLREKYQRQIVLGPARIQVSSAVDRFLGKLKLTIEEHLGDADYSTEDLARDMCMSRMQLNRKIRALTGFSSHELVREFRLQRAAELLRKRVGNVSEVGFEVGFNNLSHFARSFRERFGVLPSDYVANPTGEPAR